MKIYIFLKIFPKGQEAELKLKFAQGLTDYLFLTDHLLKFGQQARMDGAYGRGDNDYDLNYVGWSQLSEEELQAFVDGIAAGAQGEEVGEEVGDEAQRFLLDGSDRGNFLE